MIATDSPASRAIPDDNLALPVLISSPSNIGTGFFLRGKEFIYLVTAKHVLINGQGNLVSDSIDLTSYAKDPKDASVTVMSLNLKALLSTGRVKHRNNDVTVVQIGRYKHVSKDDNPINFFSEVSSASTHLNIVAAELEGLRTLDNVLIANDIIVFGYPVSIGLQSHPQLDNKRPLLRKGIVAGINRLQNSIIIDGPSYPGNSGGPVVQVENFGNGARRFNVIGIISEFVPYVNSNHPNSPLMNSGYSVVQPADLILELLGSDA